MEKLGWLALILELLGLLALCVGAFQIYAPAGYIVSGVAVFFVGLFLEKSFDKERSE